MVDFHKKLQGCNKPALIYCNTERTKFVGFDQYGHRVDLDEPPKGIEMRVDDMMVGLKRPIVFFDTETTGLNPKTERIIELAVAKLRPGDKGGDDCVLAHWRFNPGKPIPAAATAVHGITDAMVKDAPTFASKIKDIVSFFTGCDIGGYNATAFDIPFLQAEAARCDGTFNLSDATVFDPLLVYRKHEKGVGHTLTNALFFYCGRNHMGAHGALADVIATVDVFLAQVEKYGLGDGGVVAANEMDPMEAEGKLCWNAEGELELTFGKNKGKTLRKLYKGYRSYLRWLYDGQIIVAGREHLKEALEGRFEVRKA